MATAVDPPVRRGGWLVLLLLLSAYILNFLDRLMLGILAAPIKADLHLSDTQFGAIGGLAFALLYAVLALPFAYLADRTSRRAVVAAAVAVWSGFTALCGLASGFGQLFLFRVGVGVGEAGGVAPSLAIIADYFPEHRRARAMAIFYLGVPIGVSAGMFIGAHIATALNWRAAFFATGLAGLLVAPLILLAGRERPRDPDLSDRVPIRAVFPMLARLPAFWLLSLAASMSSLAGYGLNVWMPSIYMRSFGLDLRQTANFVGSAYLIGGSVGVFAGGWLADRLGGMDRGWYAKLPAIAWLVTAPVLAAALLAPNLAVVWPFLLVSNAVNILWLGPVTTTVQHLVPRPMRSTGAACFLLVNNLIGLGAGPLLIGRLSDAMSAAYGADSLRYAGVACTLFYLAAAALIALAAKPLRASWIAESSD